ncbi:MAG: 6-carboxytetrahydropterin synthase [Nitrincola lacisaponensis]|uniref:6-carboxytetrahydropterin synthase n=1 Tax=Nitrincola lacisaponensis TaxID=267850 RepID=UPI003919C67B
MKLFVDNLTHVDFSYLHPQRGLMGESWEVQLVLEGKLDEQGMICDFGVVKKRIKTWLDAHVDHMLVVATGMPGLAVEQFDGQTRVSWSYPDGGTFVCQAPEQAIALIPVDTIQQQAVARWCEDQLLALFPEQVESLALRFVAESIEGAFYHYSHGLQQHKGNCQRIAHGHRSRVQIRVDQKRRQDLELFWAQQFEDIYLGTRAHLQAVEEGQAVFRYQAPQGDFQLTLPVSRCYMMDTETTVEQIAQHLAEKVAEEYPDSVVEVRAYEGVGKGAIVTRP